MQHDTTKRITVTAIRWIAVMPASFAVLLVITWAIIHFNGQRLLDMGVSEWVVVYMIPVLAGIAGGAAYTLCVILLAPSHKAEAGIVMIVVLSAISGIIFFCNYTSLLQTIAIIIASLACYFNLKKENFQLTFK